MSRALACSRFVHLALVSDDVAWGKLELAGYQDVEADGDDPAYRVEVRYCACGSTLARRVKP